MFWTQWYLGREIKNFPYDFLLCMFDSVAQMGDGGGL